jgi:integrase/recombinase XerD
MQRRKKGRALVLTQENFKLLLRFVSSHPMHAKRDYLLVLFSFGLGMRVMELSALKVKDVIDENDRVKSELLLEKTKFLKRRVLYLEDNRIKKAIVEYIQERKERCSRKGLVFSLEQPLFLSQKKSRFSPSTLQKRFQYIYKACGIAGASSHSGRRTFATNLIENGVDIKAVSTLMGHSNINSTADYIQDNPHRLKKIITSALYER